MILGEGGSGTLDVANGGHVTDTNATLGAQAGSSGIASVDGAGSEDNNGTLDIVVWSALASSKSCMPAPLWRMAARH